MQSTITTPTVADVCAAARRAATELAELPGTVRSAALEAIADALLVSSERILAANAHDLEAGREAGLAPALIDRLSLDPQRLQAMATSTREIAALPDPVGEVIEGRRLPGGLELRKVRVPLGVVAVVYEARPNVTIDALALCLKSGNAAVLRGSRAAAESNAALLDLAREALDGTGIPAGALSLLSGGGHEQLAELATQNGLVDLLIPRGGEGLKAALMEVATVPVIYAAAGNCHVYLDASAGAERASAIVHNAKVQRPGVCNAAETLLVHAEAAPRVLPAVLRDLAASGVRLHADERVRALAAELAPELELIPATAADWDTEYLALEMAVGIVDDLDAAIAHINAHGSGHSEAIVTDEIESARRFQQRVDAACVYVNASTRFTDGGEFGMGAEIGNSTQKLHVRGPIGLRELCTYKYLIEGSGHVRG
jgi:glutamate-5-semialdehyde dehydrogenase